MAARSAWPRHSDSSSLDPVDRRLSRVQGLSDPVSPAIPRWAPRARPLSLQGSVRRRDGVPGRSFRDSRSGVSHPPAQEHSDDCRPPEAGRGAATQARVSGRLTRHTSSRLWKDFDVDLGCLPTRDHHEPRHDGDTEVPVRSAIGRNRPRRVQAIWRIRGHDPRKLPTRRQAG